MKNYTLVFCLLLLITSSCAMNNANEPRGRSRSIDKSNNIRDRSKSPNSSRGIMKDGRKVNLNLKFVYQPPLDLTEMPIPYAEIHVSIMVSGYHEYSQKFFLDDKGSINVDIFLKIKQMLLFNNHGDDGTISIYLYTRGKYAIISSEGDLVDIDKDGKSSFGRVSINKLRPVVYYEERVINFKDKAIIDNKFKFEGIGDAPPKKVNTDFGPVFANDVYNNYLLVYTIINSAILKMLDKTDPWLEVKDIVEINVIAQKQDDKRTNFPSGYIDDNKFMALSSSNSWTPITILHEFGHYAMSRAYSLREATNPSNGGFHVPCKDPVDEALAWSEGYADAFAVVMQHLLKLVNTQVTNEKDYDTINWVDLKSGVIMNVEYYECSRIQNHGILSPLSYDEGRVAAMLYDLYDSNNDNNNHEFITGIVKDDNNRRTNFGRSDVGDNNGNGHEIKPSIIFSKLLSEGPEKDSTIKDYIKKIKSTGILSKSQKKFACDILYYNYWAGDGSNCNDWE